MAEALRLDIQAAKDKMQARRGTSREMRRLTKHLANDEQVEVMAGGVYGTGRGLVVLTDRRLLFVLEALNRQVAEEFPIEKVSSVRWSAAFTGGSMTIATLGVEVEIAGMNKKDGKQMMDAIDERLATSPLPRHT
ncbi:MAG: PH domain-containing protein [Kutzneria sp.]|nr:PH domain-containing protein [Kutzneria sp.]MBV9845676.1 PH domain-containing protein [Kutzneria sp.]